MSQHQHHHKPSHSHTIAVVNATEPEGVSVVRALLGKGTHTHAATAWHVRALVQDPESAEAKRLAGFGAELMQVTDFTNKQQLQRAFHGCYGVYAMTSASNQETTHGKLLVNVALEEKVEHFVYSGGENAEAVSNSKYHAHILSHKAKVEARLREIHGMDWTCVYVAIPYSHIKDVYTPQQAADNLNVLEIRLPCRGDHPIPFVDPYTAVGPVVSEIFSNKAKYNTKIIPIVGEDLTFDNICALLSRAWEKEVTFVSVNAHEFATHHSHNPMAREIAELWQYLSEFPYFSRDHDAHLSRKMFPHPETFEQWLRATHWNM